MSTARRARNGAVSGHAARGRAAGSAGAFPVVGVGASAGGLDAFRNLLAELPDEPGLALVLVQHLDPKRASLLCQTLRRATRMRVTQVEDRASVEPDRVYVISPGVQLAIEGDLLRVSPPADGTRRPRLPIDHFFRSLAAARGRQAVGVVLSGTGTDGTLGLGAIRAHGGIALAQEPGSARFAEMPQSAVDAAVVDGCLPIAALGAELVRLARHPYLSRRTTAPAAPRGPAALEQLFASLRAASGVDFREYRQATFKPRLARRMAVRGARDLSTYLELLGQDPGEARALRDDLLPAASSFFDEPEGLEALPAAALPAILEHKAAGAPLRAWVVGCSTGEEVYGLAMLLVEFLGDDASTRPVVVFGSDPSDQAIERARTGLYSESALREVGEGRRRRFFVETERGWRIGQALRDLCVFARHDVARDPPFSKLDLVICRRVLGAFGHALQQRVLEGLHRALLPGAFLLLGRGQPVASAPGLFLPVAPGSPLFTRRPGSATARPAPVSRPTPFLRGASGPASAASGRGAGGLAVVGPHHGRGGAVGGVLRLAGPPATTLQPGAASPGKRGGARPQRGTAHEELVSLNEALRTSNEELETAQEELQATNEELSTVNDEVTSRNQELQLLNADLVNLFATVQLPIVMLDERSRVRRFTPQAAVLFGLTPAAVGTPVGEAPHQLYAPDLELWIAQTLRTGAAVEAEVQDRTERWHRLQVRPHQALDGRTDGAIVSLLDIDALHHRVADAEWARDQARSIVEAVQTPLVVLDDQLQVLSANEAFFTGLGATPTDVRGRSLFDLGGGAWDTPELRRSLAQVIEKDAPFRGLELEGDLPGAGRRTLSLSASAVRSGSSVRMILLGIEDLTEKAQGERTRAELLARAEEAQEVAERADQAKDRFLGVLSHELRTPLTSLLLQAELLRTGGLDGAKVVRASAAVERSARLQLRLVEDLLDVSSIIAGKLSIEDRWVDLAAVVRAALELLRGPAEAKALRVSAELGAAIPSFRGDPTRLQQVVANLLANSIKATPEGGRVGVALGRVDGTARLVVTDTGRGIDARFLPFVFDRFAQEEGARARGHGGLGLGLGIARHIVELHGGTIQASSPGRDLGATFAVTLPLRDALEVAEPAGRDVEEPIEGDGGAGRLTAVRVLVVDDDEARETVAELLAREGAEVRTAASAEAGLAAVEGFHPDVVLCDLAMPGEDGYGFIGRLRALPVARGGAIPALAFTALTSARDRERCLAAGFQAHLAKPAARGALLDAVCALAAPAAARGLSTPGNGVSVRPP